MVYGALTEKCLVKFLNKQDKIYRKFQISLMENIPKIKSKRKSRAKPTCMKCYDIRHKFKQCTNDTDTKEEIEKRKKQWKDRKKEGKKNYNMRYKPIRTFNRNKEKVKKSNKKEQK